MTKTEQGNRPSDESELELKARRARARKTLEYFNYHWWGFPVSALAGGIFMYFVQKQKLDVSFADLTIAILVGISIGIVAYVVLITYLRMLTTFSLNSIEYRLAKQGAEELQENIEENFFTKLVQINFKYIDQYYLQTQEQANKSFRLSMFAAVTGLAIIVVGIVMMFNGKTEPAYVTTSAGLLSEFIAAVFFYLYNRTILKMSEYHQKLVITQNISLALKIAEGLPEEKRIQSQQELINKLTENVNQYLTMTNEKA